MKTLPKYKVAIKCLVYNHEPYLRECLEGFVMQQTDFPFVAIVHDDASTDHSADIIREYAAKYPDIIHPIYETENQYSKKNGSLTKIMDTALAATGAPYIALCEGDDYWTDPKKLQKQVDFLESHPEYSMCFSNAKVIGGTNEEVHMYDFLQNRDYQAIDILKKWTIPTCTVLYRRGVRLVPNKSIVFGDIYLFLQLAQQGKVRCQNEEMACYRRHPGSASSIKSNEEMLKLYMRFVKQYEYMAKIFAANKEVSEECRNVAINNCNYVIYDNSSLLYDRFICIYRRARLRGDSMKSFCCSVYTYVIKPYLHLK